MQLNKIRFHPEFPCFTLLSRSDKQYADVLEEFYESASAHLMHLSEKGSISNLF